MLAQNASSRRASWVMRVILFLLSVFMNWVVLQLTWDAHDIVCSISSWLNTPSFSFAALLTSVISMFHHWECCLCCHDVMFNCVQMMAASSVTHNPDPLGVLPWSLCSDVAVELRAWMILDPKKEQIYWKPQCSIQKYNKEEAWGWFLKSKISF